MNCEPNEMAVVVKTEGLMYVLPKEFLGAVVTVKTPVGNGMWRLEQDVTRVLEAGYILETNVGRHRVSRGDSMTLGHLPDELLQPIRRKKVGDEEGEMINLMQPRTRTFIEHA